MSRVVRRQMWTERGAKGHMATKDASEVPSSLIWVAGHTVGVLIGFGLAVIPAYFLETALEFAGGAGSLFQAFVSGLALGLAVGGLQWLAIRRHTQAVPWVSATAVGMALGAAAFFLLATLVMAAQADVLDGAVEDMLGFGTAGLPEDRYGLMDHVVLGSLWLAFGALLGGFVGLAQWAVRPGGVRIPWGWALVDLAALGVALTAGSALRGLIWEMSGAYLSGMVGENLRWAIFSIIIGLLVTGLLWGLFTWPYLRHRVGEERG
jgi:hypothetical protein